MNSDITEQYLNKLYDDLSKEQMRLMNDIKSNNNELAKDKDNTKMITLINGLMMGAMRLRNTKKQIQQKLDM
jgi:hypothetical protein